jgi:hypothetical protein
VTPDNVVALLENIVKESGGTRLAAVVSACSTIFEAAAKTASWFAREENRSSFVCDDLWETNVKKAGFFSGLTLLFTKHRTETSCHRLLFPTRNHGIARASQVCRSDSSPLDSQSTEDILMLCAHARRAKYPPRGIAARKSFKVVLGRCAGLPLALSVASRAIAEHMDMVHDLTVMKTPRACFPGASRSRLQTEFP